MPQVFLKVVGWTFLLVIVFSSILFMEMTDEIVYRVIIGGIMILMLLIFTVVPFWIAYRQV